MGTSVLKPSVDVGCSLVAVTKYFMVAPSSVVEPALMRGVVEPM